MNMNFRTNWLDLVRFDEWQDTKLPLLALVVYESFLLGEPSESFWSMFLFSLLYGASLLAFGYLINDLADIDVDRKSGKKRTVMLLPPVLAWSICLALLLISAVSLYSGWRNPVALVLLIVSLAFAAGYSVKPLRFKERGAAGLYVASAAQRSFPALAIAACWQSLTLGLFWTSIIFFLMGLRYILLHQAMDAAKDYSAGVRTYILEKDNFGKIARLLGNVFILELGAISLLPLFLGTKSFALWLVILPYLLYWALKSWDNCRQMKIIHPVTYISLPLQTFYFLAWPAAQIALLLVHNPSLWPILLVEGIWKFRLVKALRFDLPPIFKSETK